jgi:SAM-dependent methyltransferase
LEIAVDWTNILRCPKTGNSLQLDEAASLLRVEHSELTYPFVGGIIDFCPASQDRIAGSYDRVASRYDPYVTATSAFMKALSKIIWGWADDNDLMGQVLSLLPDPFDGVLLDVPVGTGVFMADLYRRCPQATIIGVDSSTNMLYRAQARFREHGLSNVHLLRADAAHLPLRDGTVDVVLSMNGWHAFAEKQRTTSEMRRVLRKDGTLVACGYIRGARWLSDWFIRHFGVRSGFFTPPFFTADELAGLFRDFTIVRQGGDRSIAYLEATSRAHRT